MSGWVTAPLMLLFLVDWVRASCRDSGFTSELKCSSCDKLHEHNLSVELAEQCKACCEKDHVEEALVKFTSAILKVCG